MKKQLFLYTTPFLVEDNVANRAEHLTDLFSDTDRDDQTKLMADLLQFAVNEKIVRGADGVYQANPDSNTGSWIWLINWMDFRSLTLRSKYEMLMGSLESGDSRPIGLVVDLYTRLGMLYDHRLLNALAHRTLSTISLIPYNGDDEEVMTWEDIHKESPYLWVVLLLQAVVRSTVIPLV